VRTTFLLDEETLVFNGMCWSLVGEEFTRPPTGLSREEGRRRTHAAERRDKPGRRREATRRVGHLEQNLGVSIHTDRGHLYPTVTNLDSGATLSIYMDDILITELANTHRSRNHFFPSPKTSGIPGQIVDEALGSTPPYEERLGTNSRT
jgi:hypothetical protein